MNSSRPSDRGRPGHVIALLGGVLIASLVGCADDLAPPTQGTVRVQLDAQTAGAGAGARIYEGDALLAEVGRELELTLRLTAGHHLLRIEKPCATFSPQAQIDLAVSAGREQTIAWRVEPAGGIEVTSSIAGARILLDDQVTGKYTPATLDCVPPGTHTIEVELIGAIASAPQTIEVGGETQAVAFTFTAAPQARGALLELCTATLCPNCPPADEACNRLTLDPSLPRERFIAVEVHSRWSGTDIYASPSSIARDAYLGGERDGNPWAIVSGLRGQRGAGAGDVAALVTTYRGFADEFLVQDSKAGLYWIESNYVPGQLISGTVRVVAIDGLETWGAADLTKLEVWALYYKNGLTWQHPTHGLTTYYHVIREYRKLGTLVDLGASEAGDWADLPYSFDLTGDTRYGEDQMGMAVFVQNLANREVMQIIHRRITGAP